MQKVKAKWHSSIKEIPERQWDLMIDIDSIPFYKWRWLFELENSNSITPRNGWQPLYLSIYRNNHLIGTAPLFLKGHSFGEFIFDRQYIELSEYLGVNYYPKLLGMSPVSPIEGYKFLFAPKENEEKLTELMMHEIDKFCIKNKILSCNFLYVDSKWRIIAEKLGCNTWLNQNSLWTSEENKDFSEYLNRFNSNQRRNIKRERKTIKEIGLEVSISKGTEINKKRMKLMHYFYEKHCSRWGLWGSKYLSEKFFEKLASPEIRDQIILFTANRKNENNPLAMSLCVTNGEMLWGRYWGSEIEINNLHFELCYYSPIEWALKNGIKKFDPGAGGAHKQRRGFLAKSTASLHRWYNPKMDEIIRAWLPKVNKLMLEEIKSTNNDVPFKAQKPKLTLME